MEITNVVHSFTCDADDVQDVHELRKRKGWEFQGKADSLCRGKQPTVEAYDGPLYCHLMLES